MKRAEIQRVMKDSSLIGKGAIHTGQEQVIRIIRADVRDTATQAGMVKDRDTAMAKVMGMATAMVTVTAMVTAMSMAAIRVMQVPLVILVMADRHMDIITGTVTVSSMAIRVSSGEKKSNVCQRSTGLPVLLF